MLLPVLTWTPLSLLRQYTENLQETVDNLWKDVEKPSNMGDYIECLIFDHTNLSTFS